MKKNGVVFAALRHHDTNVSGSVTQQGNLYDHTMAKIDEICESLKLHGSCVTAEVGVTNDESDRQLLGPLAEGTMRKSWFKRPTCMGA